MSQNELSKVWGKFDVESGKKQPLIAHLTDVAAVFEQIMNGPLFQRHFQRVLGQPLSETLRERLCVLALWHDYGKISPKFQLKYREKIEKLKKKTSINHIDTAFNLSSIGYKEIWDELLNVMHFWENEEQKDILDNYLTWVILAHHGAVFTQKRYQKVQDNSSENYWEKNVKDVKNLDPKEALRELAALSKLWYPLAFNADGGLPEEPFFQHFFAGTLMLADWMASDRSLFPYCGECDAQGERRPSPEEEDSLAYSRRQAKKVLASLVWTLDDKRPAQVPDFEKQFGFSPNGIQQAIDKLALNPDGGLYILEAETGSGKTEAALRLYTRLLAAGYVDGLYFANPLRFAATQLFERMVKFSASSFGKGQIPVTLAVPGYLRVNDSEGLRVGRFEVDWRELNDRAVGWYAEQPKRFLASPIASGTIDQAFMAGLRIPHAHMRAAALQRSLLVIDEVHSSDAYMSVLICGLIELFRRVGGHVLLMSATLGSESTERYLKVWNETGAQRPQQTKTKRLPLAETLAVPYPLLTSSAEPPLAAASPSRGKSVRMQRSPVQQDPRAVAQLAAQCAAPSGEKGPCILILRNSVRQARRTFRELRKILPAEKIFSVNDIPTLHHSRYSPEDRRLLDREVERRFGKEFVPLDQLRDCCVLVATQTLEQSLDVDFDLIITDLCPADVLLQRIGRLFRHQRCRPAGFERPRCVVLLPNADCDWLLGAEARSYGYGTERAYVDLPSLAATWRLLEGNEVWNLPEQNRFFVEQSTHAEALRRLVNDLGAEKWQNALDEVEGLKLAQNWLAKTARLRWEDEFTDVKIAKGENMERIATRLGTMDLSVECDKPVASPLKGEKLKSFSIPAWLLGTDTAALEMQKKKEDGTYLVEPRLEGGLLSFALGSREYYYDSEGLLSQFDLDERNKE
ncbi:MAG: CRISPR-associated helicase Cas3' [Pyramidobacter sp.]|uniref:CRISPR-associated helicase Cas3' n=1 Tax=Pyramidobacter sp. TaxID=1943581 RepID=UPI002A806B50|nr:CRISPR-associated helicase Cas3' [Pyramidobacter sp.]MDY4032447.1 CRISPR-associated helicase Cas3' [Pyramidobacter sp.]